MRVIVPEYWLRRAADFGRGVVASYSAGQKEASRSLQVTGKPRIDGDPHTQTVGRVGEIAYCVGFSLDPELQLDWQTDHTGGGADIAGLSMDVKASDHPRAQYLIWPEGKTHLYEGKRFDDLALAHVVELTPDRAEVDLAGWVTKSAFLAMKIEVNWQTRREHQIPAQIVDGSWILHRRHLIPVAAHPYWIGDEPSQRFIGEG